MIINLPLDNIDPLIIKDFNRSLPASEPAFIHSFSVSQTVKSPSPSVQHQTLIDTYTFSMRMQEIDVNVASKVFL